MSATNFNLRSSTSLDPYASFELTATAIYTAGEMVKIADTVSVVAAAAAIGVLAVHVYVAAKILVPCVAITSGNLGDFAVGKKVYFDAADKEVNASSSGNTLCGRVTTAPSVGDETIEIHLQGNAAA